MGCCESRREIDQSFAESLKPSKKTSSQTANFEPTPSSINISVQTSSTQKNSLYSRNFSKLLNKSQIPQTGTIIRDAWAQEIDAYCTEIATDSNWEQVLDNSSIQIFSKNGSKYREDLPMLMCCIDLELWKPVGLIIDLLFHEGFRLKWDKQMRSMKILARPSSNEYVMSIEEHFPFKNRQYNVKSSIVTTDSEAKAILYSSNEWFKVNSKLELGEIVFEYYKIVANPDETTRMLMISQVDYRLRNSNVDTATRIVINKLRALRQRIHEDNSESETVP